MHVVLPLLMALAAQERLDIDAVTPGPGQSATPTSAGNAPHVTVIAERPMLTLGSDDALGLAIEVSGFPAGATLALRALTNVGSVDPPAPGAVPGRYATRFVA